MDNKTKWDNDSNYREQVIRELENKGTITKLPEHEFNELVEVRLK